jgi:NAD(P)-dependent dehydrogenase (short-subunit alcohol dehydrogenase family)
LGADVALLPADLANPAAIGPLFDSVEAVLGPVDILVNNAAHFENPDTVFDVSAGTFDRYFAVNSRAPALLMGEFARRYRARGACFGRIINISTDASRAFGTQIGYGASKLALEALTRSVAHEVGPLGITVKRGGARSSADRLHHARDGTAAPADDSAASPRRTRGHRGRCRPPGVGRHSLDDGAGHPGGRWRRSIGWHDKRLQPTGDGFIVSQTWAWGTVTAQWSNLG